jgi:branched-chain amino acid transport system substrate-binding protein
VAPPATESTPATPSAVLAVGDTSATSTASPVPDVTAATSPTEVNRGFRFVDRRALLRLAGTAALAAPASSLLAACSGSSSGSTVRPVRIGLVTPESGTLSSWANSDLYVKDLVQNYFSSHGMQVGNTTHPVEIYVEDSQSSFARAGKAATQLIYGNNVDIMLVGATTDTVVPVADQCEALQVPCISTMAPWESFFYNRGGDATKPFTWTYHFFGGLSEYYNAYQAMWNQSEVRHSNSVGVLLPNDLDGSVFGNPNLPFLANLRNNFNPSVAVYTPGPQADFTNALQLFQGNKVQVVTGVMNASDLQQFEKQASTAGFSPVVATFSKAVMFEADLRTLGATVTAGMTTEMFWSSAYPYVSFLTNQKASQLASAFYTATGDVAPQQLGASMALFDVAAQVLQRASSLDDKAGIAAALKGLTAHTMLGTVKFGGKEGVPANVATLPLNGGQWTWDPQNYVFSLNLVNAAGDPSIPVQTSLTSMSGASA